MQEAPTERPYQAEYKVDEERYAPRVWHRVALVALIFVVGRFLEPPQSHSGAFDLLAGAALAYTGALWLLARKLSVGPRWVLALDLALVMVFCHLTGGMASKVKYLGLAYFYLLSPFLSPRYMKSALLAYSVAVTFMLFAGPGPAPGGREAAREALLNLLVLNGAGWPSILLAGYIQRVRELQRTTAFTFHSLNSALHLRTQNLQAALDALTQAHEHLKAVDEKKTRFLANVSHELRTPLSSVRSFSEILLNYEDLDRPTQKEFLGIIAEEAGRLTLLINDVLDVVRLDSGKVGYHPTQVDIAEVVASAVKAQQPIAGQKGLYIRFDAGGGPLPRVKGDKNQLIQVMLNLLNNALKFTSKGGITVSARVDGEQMEVTVADTGEGIYPEEKGLIFEEFYRVADNVSGRPKGSGLGLPISRRIVELHGGRVWVDSDIGKGSTFRFTVPLDLGELAVPASGRAAPAPAQPERQKRREPYVLVVDTNPAVRQMLRRRLESLGFKTLGAENGKTALKIASEWEPDVIVSGILAYSDRDANMHKGLRALQKTSEIPVVLTCLINDPRVGLQVVVNAFVSRPVDRFELTRIVETQLARVRGPVLVVSPDRLEARTLQLILGNEGYTVLLADETTWQEACRREGPGLVILDAALKGDLSREIAASLRRNGATAKAQLVLVTEIPMRDSHVISGSLGRAQFTPDAEALWPVLEGIGSVTGAPATGPGVG